MTFQRCGSLSVRRFLSEGDEKEALHILKGQLRHQKRVTSDDIRLAVRVVASKGGSVSLPSDFPPSRWVLDFRRVHGFAQFNSFAFSSEAAQWGSGGSSDDARRKGHSEKRPSFDMETQKHTKMQAKMQAHLEQELHHSSNFDQRHRRFQQQQQQRMVILEDRRGTRPLQREADEGDDARSNASSASLESGNDGSARVGSSSVTVNGSNTVEELHDNASSERGYRLSHTVPAETWEKAIAAVEDKGMSLRAAAKVYGVHFAALHRRVKKRARCGLSNGQNEYFHPSDESGIVRVVVARAELGVLMTFAELMSLVEASALRKLPDITVDAARALLDRFQSRNEQAIRHIIEDWPPPGSQTVTRLSFPVRTQSGRNVTSLHSEQEIGEVGRDMRSNGRRFLGDTGGAATAAAVAAAVSASGQFVPPNRLDLDRSDRCNGLSKQPTRLAETNGAKIVQTRSASQNSSNYHRNTGIEPQERAMEEMTLRPSRARANGAPAK